MKFLICATLTTIVAYVVIGMVSSWSLPQLPVFIVCVFAGLIGSLGLLNDD